MESALKAQKIVNNAIPEVKIEKYSEFQVNDDKIPNIDMEITYNEVNTQDIQSNTDNNDHDLCRLNYLPTNCLIKCFENLPISDLLHVCGVDEHFQTVIIEHVIHKKLIDFTNTNCHWSFEQIFRVFGRKMRRIKVEQETRTNDLSYVFKTIIKYCKPGNLTEISLRFCHTIIDYETLQQAIPMFSNLRKLILLNYNNVNAYDDVMPIICNTTSKLEYLKLVSVNLSERWADVQTLNNLKEFYFHERYTSCQSMDLHQFLSASRNLTTFSYMGVKDISDATAFELHDTLKNLKRFNDFSIGGNCAPIPRYQCISKFTNIQHLSITSHSYGWKDIFEPLMELTQQTTLKSLNILTSTDCECDSEPSINKWCNALVQRNLCHLESFGVQIECDSWVESVHRKDHYDCGFLAEFLSQLKGSLRHVAVHSKQYVIDAHKILEALPGMYTFSIVDMVVPDLSKEMDKIARVLRNCGEKQQKLLRFIVNRHQNKELQVI